MRATAAVTAVVTAAVTAAVAPAVTPAATAVVTAVAAPIVSVFVLWRLGYSECVEHTLSSIEKPIFSLPQEYFKAITVAYKLLQ